MAKVEVDQQVRNVQFHVMVGSVQVLLGNSELAQMRLVLDPAEAQLYHKPSRTMLLCAAADTTLLPAGGCRQAPRPPGHCLPFIHKHLSGTQDRLSPSCLSHLPFWYLHAPPASFSQWHLSYVMSAIQSNEWLICHIQISIFLIPICEGVTFQLALVLITQHTEQSETSSARARESRGPHRLWEFVLCIQGTRNLMTWGAEVVLMSSCIPPPWSNWCWTVLHLISATPEIAVLWGRVRKCHFEGKFLTWRSDLC